ncbi:hypothetical protein Q31b_03570 [Novipirellula aureliae]|uniref:ImpA N-terminal domain-containing protein n=1 Tax=Novipirellula aureliae TaxID=2527966 RepID=A0A5C6ECC2_9BACT|nr:type VI secretion system protein TssA [Novipirellula aureliae]TWU45186.1 hypothetical protein Q31b_03570 [Novipirellula aureliae]
MASEPTLDLQRMMAPISDDHPSGSYLRDTDYARLQRAKDARTRAVALEKKVRELEMYTEEDLQMIPEEDRHIESPDWRAVRDICTEILAEHSKDLWVASWLIEANTRLSGFAGLRDGFSLVSQIVDQYWDAIYPPRDEDEGYLGTVSQLSSLNGEDGPGVLLVPIEALPVIPGEPDFTFAAYRLATKGSSTDIGEADFFAAARQVDPDRLRNHAEDIDQAIETFAQMTRILEEKCGEHEGLPVAPPSSQIRSVLTECQRAFRLITRDCLSDGDSHGDNGDGDDGQYLSEAGPDATNNVSATVAQGGGVNLDPSRAQVANREDAFRLLLRASEFFRKTEPHSPVSYMLQQAVRFGRMELPDLLQELITDEEVLKRFAERTGVEIKQERDEY